MQMGQKGQPMQRRWVPLTLAAAAATVAVIVGIAWLADREQPPVPAPGTTSGPASTEPDPARTVTVPVYYVGDTAAGPRLFREDHTLSGVTGSDAAAAVQEAIGSPPEDPDYQGWVPADGFTTTVTERPDGFTIDLSSDPFEGRRIGAVEAQVWLQALVWTANASSGSRLPVTFTLDGRPAETLPGVDPGAPVERASADSVLSSVSISAPAHGMTVPSGFTVRGDAATFEANVVWELRQSGRVVRHGFTTAGQCCTLSPYAFTVSAPPGDYTLVVHDTDESDGEGVGTAEDTKDLTIR